PTGFDMGLALGEFTATMHKRYPTATIRGITLSKNSGGLEIMVPNWKSRDRLQIQFADITMGSPAASMPVTHPDSSKFSSGRPFLDEKFDLIFCGAAVQTTHTRAEYRQSRERFRLITSQIILALLRIHPNDSSSTADLIHRFTRFSNVRLFKPRRKHAIRSSSYMIATKVRPQSEEAQFALQGWKAQWNNTTFQIESDLPSSLDISEQLVHDMLVEFGTQLIALATPVWEIQAQALRKS
ncbi:hypothetical protein GQ44DRAFT_595980, partial [Phaeosphaeriaceae sp. PMI808]